MKKVVFIAGATASGKSSFAHSLIDKYFKNSSILSMDSMQIYKYMDIGSAKPSALEIEKYRYSMVDFIHPLEKFTLKDYIDISAQYIENATTPLFIVGGSGLYMNALKNGLFDEDSNIENSTVRSDLLQRFENEGLNSLFETLKTIDIESANTIDKNNPRRVIRALEVCYNTGLKFSEIKKLRKPKVSIDYISYIVNPSRDILYQNINNRVDKMFESGLVDEVKHLIMLGVNNSMTSMQAIGYKETIEYINNKNMSEAELKEKIKLNTRHYAKRQITWFRKEGGTFIDTGDNNILSKVVEDIEKFIQ